MALIFHSWQIFEAADVTDHHCYYIFTSTFAFLKNLKVYMMIKLKQIYVLGPGVVTIAQHRVLIPN